MKCKTCGYDVKEPLTHCPMCGTRVSSDPLASAATTELSWNTKDFPKPKEMEDINMAWPEFNNNRNTASISEEEISAALEKKRPVTLMSEDASEGYVSIPDKREERAEQKTPAAPAPAPEKPKAAEPSQEQPYWYTQKFTATGVMQTGPAWPMAPGSPAQSYPATAKIETMTLSDPIPIVPGASGTQEDVNKSFTLSDLIKEAPKKPEDGMRPSGSGFYTFQRKNDEFQKLLDREYDRIHAMHGDDYDPLRGTIHPISSDQPVKAKELSAFEQLLLDGEDQASEETPAQKFFSQDPEQPKADGSVEDLKDPDLPDVEIPTGDPSTYDIKKIENTIRELEQQEVIAEHNRGERKKRLEKMAAAREAYFRSLDAIAAGKDPDAYEPEPEPAPAGKAAQDDSALFASDGSDPAEPTIELPVGGILEAISAEKPARTIALHTAGAAVASSEPFKTVVFKRISEDAEERAKRYEQADPFAPEAPAEDVLSPEELEAELRSPTEVDKSFDELMKGLRTTARTTIAGAKDAERIATKYDLDEELKGVEAAEGVASAYEGPAEQQPEAPATEAPATEASAGEATAEEASAEEATTAEATEEAPAEELPAEESLAEASAGEQAEAFASEETAEEAPEEQPAETPSEHTQPFEPVSDDTSSLSFLYEEGAEKEDEKEDEASEDEAGPRHIFLKIIIAILIICALFELIVLGMSRFMPDAQATQTIVSVEEVIREAIVSAFNSVVNAVKGLFGN